MGTIPFAFSVHNFVTSVGAYAGFASIIGLAILVLLYFAQARETATLREHAYEAAQRIQQLEARLTQLTRRGAGETAPPAVASAPQPAIARPAAVGAVAAAGAATAVVSRPVARPAPVLAGAPAGVGAPALSAATRLIPVAAINHSDYEDTGADTGSATAVVAPPPATVAGAAAGAAAVASGANGSSRAPGGAPAPVSAAPPAPPRSQPGGNGAQRQPLPPPRSAAPQGTSPTRKVLAVVITLLGVAAVVVALLLLTSNSSSSSSSSTNAASNAPQAHKKAAARTVAVVPSTVNVAVLNGTAMAGLAHRVSLVLVGDGFKQGAVATAADQTRTATVVGYMPGKRAQGVAVAHALKLGPAVVQPVDQSTQAVACPPPTPCPSAVIVTVGSDLQNTP